MSTSNSTTMRRNERFTRDAGIEKENDRRDRGCALSTAKPSAYDSPAADSRTSTTITTRMKMGRQNDERPAVRTDNGYSADCTRPHGRKVHAGGDYEPNCSCSGRVYSDAQPQPQPQPQQQGRRQQNRTQQGCHKQQRRSSGGGHIVVAGMSGRRRTVFTAHLLVIAFTAVLLLLHACVPARAWITVDAGTHVTIHQTTRIGLDEV